MKTTFKQWLKYVSAALIARAHAPWRIGDLMNYGESAFGEDYAQALDECLVDYHTIQNWRWVARCFKLSRRRESLSWSHHEVVAKLPEKEQDNWLNMAEESRLSVQNLRQLVKGKYEDEPIVVDKRFSEDFTKWVDETISRADLLRAIKRGTLEVVGFDKRKHMPLVKTKATAA